MSKKEKKVKTKITEEAEALDIPEDEIWTYQIEGLAAPKINQSYKNATGKKVTFIVLIVIAVIISLYFSVRALLNTGDLEYKEIESGYELVQFSNNGLIKHFNVNYTAEIDNSQIDPSAMLAGGVEDSGAKELNFIVYDEAKPVTTIHEYAFNCDGTLQVINIGANVTNIESKAFYSCWSLQCIYVDENNPNYCDVDGVLYNKDKTEIICYPIDHDKYLRAKTGYDNLVDDDGKPMEELWGTTEKYDEAFFKEYNKAVRTYVLPSTVERIGDLCFNYANLRTVYLPEGLKEIATLGFFDTGNLQNIYSYKTDTEVTETAYTSDEALGKVYPSLPEGLERIGSDCFTHGRGLTYMYIPSSVTYIGHHAFWDMVYKEGKELKGLSQMNVAADEATFKQGEIGGQWLPKYDYLLFQKNVDVNYSATREAQ
ncbi:MAG: leucine-rich repeat protein [Clostridia bacterium]|nr:leucine-rich repeat protein [Clostridia bacterium]